MKINVGRFIGYTMLVVAVSASLCLAYYGTTHSKRTAYNPTNLSERQTELQAQFMAANATRAKQVEPLVRRSDGQVAAYQLGDHVSKSPPEFMLADGTVVLTRAQKFKIADHTLVENPFFPFFGQEVVTDKDRDNLAATIFIGILLGVFCPFLPWLMWGFHRKAVVSVLLLITATILFMGSIRFEAVAIDAEIGTAVLQGGSVSICILTLIAIGLYLLSRYPAKTTLPAAQAT